MSEDGNRISISLVTRAEPLTPAANPAHDDETRWALCDAYHALRSQIERYAQGKTLGQSILLAGHRGSGKTTLVHLAIQQVRWLAEGKVDPPRRTVNVSLKGKWDPSSVIELKGTSDFDGVQDADLALTITDLLGRAGRMRITGLRPLLVDDQLELTREEDEPGEIVFRAKFGASGKPWRAFIGGDLDVGPPEATAARGNGKRIKAEFCINWDNEGSAEIRLPNHLLAGEVIESFQIQGTLEARVRRQFAAIPFLVPLHGPDLFRGARIDDDGRRWAEEAMAQIRRAVHRALSEEMGRRLQDRASLSQDARIMEAAVQLRVELDHIPELPLLRMYWERAGLLPGGLLQQFRREAGRITRGIDNPPQSQGLKEIFALHTAIEAVRPPERSFSEDAVWTGGDTVDRTQGKGRSNSPDAGEVEHGDVVSTVESLSPRHMSRSRIQEAVRLAAPLLSLLAGAFAAHAVIEVLGPISTAAISVITVLLTYSFLIQTIPGLRHHTLISDLSVASQNTLLQVLAERGLDAGFAPIFVIDELDKIPGDLDGELRTLMRRFRHFVTERGFFCFVADRSYYEQFQAEVKTQSYSIQDTYYADRLLICHGYKALHEYLRKDVLRLHDSGRNSEISAELLRYVILLQSTAHLGDLSRVLKEFSEGERIRPDHRFQVLWTVPGYRLAVLLQVAIEYICQDPVVAARLRQEPHFTQWLHDALHHFPREWRNDVRTVRYSRGGGQCTLPSAQPIFELLENRLLRPGATESPDAGRVANLDERNKDFLFHRMDQLADYLEQPHFLAFRLVSRLRASGQRVETGWPKLAVAVVLQSIPLLIISRSEVNGKQFHWTFNQYGQLINDENVDPRGLDEWAVTVTHDDNRGIVTARLAKIEALRSFLEIDLGIANGLQALHGAMVRLLKDFTREEFWRVLSGGTPLDITAGRSSMAADSFEDLVDALDGDARLDSIHRLLAFECLLHAEWKWILRLLAVAAGRRGRNPSNVIDLDGLADEQVNSKETPADWSLQQLAAETGEKAAKITADFDQYGRKFTRAAIDFLVKLSEPPS